MSIVTDISVHQGEDISIVATVSVAITGWSLRFALSDSKRSPTLLSKTTGGGGIVITNGAAGICTVTIASSDLIMSPSDPNRLDRAMYYSLSRTDSGSRGILAEGKFTLNFPSAA